MQETICVIGGGIAGCASVLRALQYIKKVIWICGNKKNFNRSRAKWVKNIDNMIGIHPQIMLNKIEQSILKAKDIHGESKNEILEILDHEYFISTKDIIDNVKERINKYESQANKHYVNIVEQEVVSCKKHNDHFIIKTHETEFSANYVVCATGLMDVQPTIYKQLKDKELAKISWIFPYANEEQVLYCIRCEGHLTNTQKVAVIGHSEVALQVACMIYERYENCVALLLNGEEATFSDKTKKLAEHYNIQIHPEKIQDIVKENKRDLRGFILSGEKRVDVHFAFVSLGIHKVYHDYLGPEEVDYVSLENKETSRIIVDDKGESKTENLFCVGDMATHQDRSIMMQVYTSQQYAVLAMDTIDRRIRAKKRQEFFERHGIE